MQLWCKAGDGRWVHDPVVSSVQIGSGDRDGGVVGDGIAIIVPHKEHGRARAVLITRVGAENSLTVNGYPPLGLTLLEDRDEIVIRGESGADGSRFVFAEREPARVFQFSEPTARSEEIQCARCHKPLHSGDAVVRCPACQRFFHEGLRASGERRACYSYDLRCGGCQTSREAMSWSPADGEETDGQEPGASEVAE
jgi:hypothetical protein